MQPSMCTQAHMPALHMQPAISHFHHHAMIMSYERMSLAHVMLHMSCHTALCRLTRLNINGMRTLCDATVARLCTRDVMSHSMWNTPSQTHHVHDDMLMMDVSMLEIPSLTSTSTSTSTSTDMDMMLSLLSGHTSTQHDDTASTSTVSSDDVPSLTYTHLHMAYAYTLTDASLTSIATCVLLHTLDMTHVDHISDAGIITLMTSCHHIHTLMLSGCHQLSDASVTCIATSHAAHDTLCHLEMASIPTVTCATWSLLTQHAHHLTHLNLSYTTCDDAAITHMSHDMQHLELDSCVGITDACIGTLVSCTQLSHLNLTACSTLTPTGIHHLSTHASLTWLSLAHIPCIDDTCMSHLACCHTLRHLSVQSCVDVTRDGVQQFRAYHGRVAKRAQDVPCACRVLALHA